jgi:hypothetical protein
MTCTVFRRVNWSAHIERPHRFSAGRAGLVATPPRPALWAIIGLAMTIAGALLGHHAHLTGWGIAFLAAVVAGAAAWPHGTGVAESVITRMPGRQAVSLS